MLGVVGATLLSAARRLRPGLLVALAQVMAVVLFLLAPVLTFVLLPEPRDSSGPRACKAVAVAAALRTVHHRGHDVVLAEVFLGPEILYRTDFDVVIGPYHRNTAGTRDSHAIMAATDFEEARRVAATRGIRFIATCPGVLWYPLVQRDAEGTLYHALQTGTAPDWLRRLPPGSPEQRVVIWEVTGG
jgi:hypothetical protein